VAVQQTWLQGPPWDGDQAGTLALCLEMAREGGAA